MNVKAPPEPPELPKLVVQGGTSTPTRYDAYSPPKASLIGSLWRLRAWLWTWMRFWSGTRVDQALRRDSTPRRAVRLRRLMERMDPTAIRVARLLALRLDLMPLPYATELYRLSDEAPAMGLDHALQRVEIAMKGTIAERFLLFDPEPILSDSISCVYQAQLRNGDEVAVRVRRRRVAQRLAHEARALDLLATLARFVAPSHTDLLQHARADLQPLLMENLDFIRVGRLQQIFRKKARTDRMKHVTAARVHIQHTTADVLVSEFVSGVFLSEINAAVANDDQDALRMFQELDIDPADVGRRLLHVCWWQVFENLFFCQAPDPQRIVVRPGGSMVFVEIGATGRLGNKRRRNLLTALECFEEHDVEGAVDHILHVVQPLPYIDVHEYTKHLEGIMWTRMFAMENKDAEWWEHASTGLWLALFSTNREYDVTMSLNVSRLFQSLVMYDHLAAQIWPEMRVLKEFRRYRRRSARRIARVGSRKLRRESRRAPVDPAALLVQLQPAMRRVATFIEGAVEDVPVQYIALSRKGAYSTSQAIWALVVGTQVTTVIFVVAVVWRLVIAVPVQPGALVLQIVMHPLYMLAVLAVVVLAARRILMRLSDTDLD